MTKLENSNFVKSLNCDKLWWNSNWDDIQKLRLWWNLNGNGDKNQKLKLWQNSKSKIVTKLKNSKHDKTQIVREKTQKLKILQLKLWQNLRTQMLTNLKTQMVTKLKNSNCVTSSNCDETQIVMKLKNWKSEKILNVKKKTQTQNVTKLELWQTWKLKLLQNSILRTQKLKLWQNLKFYKFQFMKKKNFKIVFKWEHLDTLTSDEMFCGQRFAILAMFCLTPPPLSGKIPHTGDKASLDRCGE